MASYEEVCALKMPLSPSKPTLVVYNKEKVTAGVSCLCEQHPVQLGQLHTQVKQHTPALVGTTLASPVTYTLAPLNPRPPVPTRQPPAVTVLCSVSVASMVFAFPEHAGFL